MPKDIQISIVPAKEVRPLRHAILRPGRSFKTTFFDRDDEPDTRHFAVYVNHKVTSIATVFPEPFDDQPNLKAYRLRGMATERNNQGAGYGSMVLDAILEYLKRETDAEILWCNARKEAFGFYEKLGFKIVGKIFYVPGIGPHKKGYYVLRNRR